MFAALPQHIQKLAEAAYQLFRQDPHHPSLRLHPLQDNDKGRHRKGSFSVSITMKYRAIYAVDDDTNVWYWIGTHNDYENFIGKK
jgi:mRNA-degrading endonuclease YafQ of YafQ-DinJ toxin-antitoxin module